ncbi:MAG TPA: serine/threonine-protein kinase [Gemmatimonadales bacterium]|nr:serine/threonine-protein kinase [Gemmatimonadales bacterium]
MTDLLERLRTALRSTYAVERAIGTGGMATVYLAEDLKHHRRVAIKVLRADLAASVAADRFLREIEMAARLQHPHILPVYDSGRVPASAGGDAILYYVMPFVEGESLRDRLDRDRRLPIEEAVEIAREVASALAYAHGHGVVHRDIKPENILLSGGHAVVADFGIAKALASGAQAIDSAAATRLTQVGLAIGTPAYMSPEQATAESIDARSDIYSLGCVVYEMLAGTPPFTGPTAQAVMTKSIAAPRPRLRQARDDVPAGLEAVVARAMAKEPADRFPSAAEFSRALGQAITDSMPAATRSRRVARLAVAALVLVLAAGGLLTWRQGRASASPVREGAELIAVLPFETRGGGAELMGEGMVDLISANLDAVGGIRAVDPRTVLHRWRRRGGERGLDREGALAVGRDVRAGSVLLGSVVTAGQTVRLGADLYTVAGERLAHAQVDGPADSVMALVDDLSLALLREIWRSQQPIPELRVSAITTGSVDAIRAYLQGEQFYRRSQWDSAIAAFGRAVERDSTFALANFRLAVTYGWTASYGSKQSRDASAAAVRFADRLPPRDRMLIVGYDLFEKRDPAAVDSMRRFVSLYPDDIDGWYFLGEAQYHARDANPLAPEALRAPFDSVLRRDSSLAPAAIHPIELTLLYRDSTGYRAYVDLIGQAMDTTEARGYHDAGAIIWGAPAARDSAMRRLLARKWSLAHMAHMARTVAAPEELSSEGPGLAGLLPPKDPRVGDLTVGRALLLAGLGRVREARAVVDTMAPGPGDRRLFTLALAALAGLTPSSTFIEALGERANRPVSGPFEAYFRATLALTDRQLATAERAIAQGRAGDSTKWHWSGFALLDGAEGWLQIARGDTTGGIARLRGALQRLSGNNVWMTAPLRMQLALALVARPATRPEGIRRLRYGFDQDPLYTAIPKLALARVLHDVGDRQGAIDAYTEFLRLWKQADPQLQPRVREAREALRELAGEPGS